MQLKKKCDKKQFFFVCQKTYKAIAVTDFVNRTFVLLWIK